MNKDGKRVQILRAAERLLADRRFHEVTLGEVARVAAVGKGTIYQYFDDKEDLFFQVAAGAFDDLCLLLGRKNLPGASFDEQLLDACVQITGFFQRHRPLLSMMQSEDARMSCSRGRMRARWFEKRVKLVEALAGIMRKGVAEEKLRSDVPPAVLAEFLLGMIRTRALRLENAPGPMRDYRLVTDLFRNGAAAAQPAFAEARAPA